MRKILSLVVACMMLVSCFALTAFADATTFTMTASTPDDSGYFTLTFNSPVELKSAKVTLFLADGVEVVNPDQSAVEFASSNAFKVTTHENFQMNNEGKGMKYVDHANGEYILIDVGGVSSSVTASGDIFTVYMKKVADITENPFSLVGTDTLASSYGGINCGGANLSLKYRASASTAVASFDWENLKAADEPEFGVDVTGTTLNCWGKVDATVTNYGVEFTADSTVNGAKAQKYYGAMNGDTVKDYNGATTFTFGDWDGTFSIVLEGVHAGDKTVNFFANDTAIADTTFTVTVE